MDVTDPSYASGKVLAFEPEAAVRQDWLETFPYEGAKQKITYQTQEFSAVCPYSGLPDMAKLVIEYCPAQKIVELKSLKYYVVSYRNVGIFQEAATARIFNDLLKLLTPQWLRVELHYNTRGGIDAISVIDSADQTKKI